MKKVIVLIFSFYVLYGINNDNKSQNLYLNYTNKIINYYFKLDLDKIKSPFYRQISQRVTSNIKNIKNKEIIRISLISILNNQAYIKVEKYLGDKLIKTNKKWLKLKQTIYNCKLIKLTNIKAIFRCENKILIKSLNKKILFKRKVENK